MSKDRRSYSSKESHDDRPSRSSRPGSQRSQQNQSSQSKDPKMDKRSSGADSSSSLKLKETSQNLSPIDYGSLCSDALKQEETEAISRDSLDDLNYLKNLRQKIEQDMGSFLFLKETGSDDMKFSQLRRSILMNLADLKKLNRVDKFRFKKARDDVADMRQKVEEKKLQLDNMQYETSYLLKEANNCRDFFSRDEYIPLAPMEEFFRYVPPDLLKPGTEDDHHKVHIARLKWELRGRENLEEKMRKLESKKMDMNAQISTIQHSLSDMLPELANLVKATTPIKDELSIPDMTIMQHMNSRDMELDTVSLAAVDLELGCGSIEESEMDITRFRSTITQIESNVIQVLEIKEANPSQPFSTLQKSVILDLSAMKMLFKRSNLRLYLAQQNVDSSKLQTDELHSKLASLEYQVNYVRTSIDRCSLNIGPIDEYINKIKLCPVDDFYKSAPEHIARPIITHSDEHELMLARLRWELSKRKSLKRSLTSRLNVRKKLKGELDILDNKFSRLEILTSQVISAARPLSHKFGNS